MGLTGRCSSCSSSNKNRICTHEKGELCRLRSSASRNALTKLTIHEMGPICKARKKIAAVFPESDEDLDLANLFGKEGLPDDDKKCMWLSSGSASPSNCLDDYRSLSLLDFSIDEWLVSLLSISQNSGHSDEERISQEYSCGCGQSSSNSTSCDNLSPYSANLDLSPPRIWDKDPTGFRVSLVNLDGEDSKWISDTESELDYFQSDFPSPSYKSICCSLFNEAEHEKPQFVSEAADLEDFNTDNPLFWPYDGKSDWGSEVTWDFLIMSPRKNNHNDKVGTFEGGAPLDSVRLRVHGRKMKSEKGCKRRLVFSSESKSTTGNNQVRRINDTMPSRLSKSTKISMEIVPLNMGDIEYWDALDEDFTSNEELPIETLLGLNEFDGHEGIELEFNNDGFSLDECL